MAFLNHALRLGLTLVLPSFLACTDQKDAGNHLNEENAKTSDAFSNSNSQNQLPEKVKQTEDHASKGEISEAIKLLSVELNKSPENTTTLYKLGNLYLLDGDTAKAITSIQQSIEKGNKDPEAIMKIGFLLANNNDAKCLKYAQSLINESKTAKTTYMGYFLKGIYFANIGERVKALNAFDQTIIENYRFVDAYIEKAILLYENKEFNNSIALLKKGIEVNKFQADLYYWIGRNCEKLKEMDECIYAYEQTLALDPSFENAKTRLDSINKIKNK